MTDTPHRHAVFGHPIAHSLSPKIHAAFGMQTGIPLRYDAIDAPPETFSDRLFAYRQSGGGGANVTLPLKGQAYGLCVEHSPYAARTGVVNTLEPLDGGGWRGHNTDGPGLVTDLAERHHVDLRERDVLLLGAGGAAQGVAYALLDAGIHALTITNRHPERADALADRIGKPGRVHVRYWKDLAVSGSWDLVINATAAGVQGEGIDLPFAILAPRAVCYDLSYGKNATTFLAWAQAAGAARCMDGLGMLVEQAAEAFAIWHGKRPDTVEIYDQLRGRPVAA
ncbi:shikimate dehydrogenase [Tahibacter amnicola]|uniref:Shikimate dehydrogenase (NADP(+)) n=1 Tax=Tahibacter amnicola TaxID=2976241 RepID=A0ABY6BFW2_9GAMM|nr:shikimate dehydrogenase [Tahibacter amnicola]UXI68491.1 shikimate dehydrogenase [Tahibacter amnicola]